MKQGSARASDAYSRRGSEFQQVLAGFGFPIGVVFPHGFFPQVCLFFFSPRFGSSFGSCRFGCREVTGTRAPKQTQSSASGKPRGRFSSSRGNMPHAWNLESESVGHPRRGVTPKNRTQTGQPQL